ncbi:hypothetical protein LOD99_14321 [Oopsacas minuta]|uniref:G-patch domain-containing protein n=1 Tax=Oopsacas minuta TaxID=111878 RepID=A0AAV7KH28_9METZ|nr:hypothetical protein LOD99_14321 [Oopsacas minuta]
MSQLGIAFRIKALDSNSKSNSTKINNISSWSLSHTPDRIAEENTLVIPLQPDTCIHLNRENEDRALENEAVRAILRETSQHIQEDAITVPLTSTVGDRESGREDYSDIPVSSFGKAALRGMGWKEGEAIGKTRKGLVTPIELIPHAAGLGLGALSRKNKHGKHKHGKDPLGPVVGTDGRVKHHKGLDEKVELASNACLVKAGSYVRINEGAHEGLLGKIRELDSEGNHVTVSLSLGESSVYLPLSDVVLLDVTTMQPVDPNRHKNARARKEVIKSYGLILRGKQDISRSNSTCSNKSNVINSYKQTAFTDSMDRDKKDNKKTIFRSKSLVVPSRRAWIRSDLKVRLISKSYKKGRYYNSKVNIIDVVSPGVCMCQTDQGQLLEEVSEEMLETLLPKDITLPVMIVSGEYSGQIAYIQEKDPSTCIATVLLEDLDACVALSYDNICQIMV